MEDQQHRWGAFEVQRDLREEHVMSYIVQQSNPGGGFPNPTTPGNWIVAGASAGNGGGVGSSPEPLPSIGAFSDNGGNSYATPVIQDAYYTVGGPFGNINVAAS